MAKYPAEVASLLENLTNQFPKLLGDNLVGIYIFGSMTQGAFDAARSDIDLMVVTREEVSDRQYERVGEWFEQQSAANAWTARLQMMILGRDDLLTMNAQAVHYQFGKFSRGGSDGNPIPWINILETGITLIGPSPAEFVTEILPETLHETLIRELRYLREELGNPASEWRDKPKYRAYAILTVCRILYTFQKGKIVSKPRAAVWSLRKLPTEWHSLVEAAVAHDAGRSDKLPLTAIKRFVQYALEVLGTEA